MVVLGSSLMLQKMSVSAIPKKFLEFKNVLTIVSSQTPTHDDKQYGYSQRNFSVRQEQRGDKGPRNTDKWEPPRSRMSQR